MKEYLEQVVSLYNQDKHSATGMTPEEAREDKNIINEKENMELHRVSNRKYPTLNVGDQSKSISKNQFREVKKI